MTSEAKIHVPMSTEADRKYDERITEELVFQASLHSHGITVKAGPAAIIDRDDKREVVVVKLDELGHLSETAPSYAEIVEGAEQVLGSSAEMSRDRMLRALAIAANTIDFYDRLFYEGAVEFAEENNIPINEVIIGARHEWNIGESNE